MCNNFMRSSHLFQLRFVRASPLCIELKPKFKVISFHVHLKRQEIPIEILGPSLRLWETTTEVKRPSIIIFHFP